MIIPTNNTQVKAITRPDIMACLINMPLETKTTYKTIYKWSIQWLKINIKIKNTRISNSTKTNTATSNTVTSSTKTSTVISNIRMNNTSINTRMNTSKIKDSIISITILKYWLISKEWKIDQNLQLFIHSWYK